MARRTPPEINAGSMADIAFLLLIFFLVTTTMDVDTGISRKLPEKQDPNIQPPKLKEKNVFVVTVNRNNDILVNGETYLQVNELREKVIKFIDNGAGLGNPIDGAAPAECTWCEGEKDPNSSDHPNKAIISLESDRGTSYGMYVSVQNELVGAYSFLRNRLSKKLYGRTFDELSKESDNDPNNESLKAKVEDIKKKYPQIISEAEPFK
jgi:biopolymer transport protein ExbD